MGVDVRIKAMKPIVCQHCGEIACYQEVEYESFGGYKWLSLLEDIGYCEDYYAEDMILADEQVKILLQFLENNPEIKECYLVNIVNYALNNNYKVAINADW